MLRKKELHNPEGKLLAKLLLEKKQLREKYFSPAEQKIIHKLMRHPFNILSKKKGQLMLTENGQSVARGYLKGLLMQIGN